MPSAGVSSVPSVSVIFCSALKVSKQSCGLPRLQARHWPHTARQFRITKSPGSTAVTPGPDRLDRARGLVAEQERVLVVDAALAVGQVGVADPAGDDVDHGLAGSGVRDDDVDQSRRVRPCSVKSRRALSDSWASNLPSTAIQLAGGVYPLDDCFAQRRRCSVPEHDGRDH